MSVSVVVPHACKNLGEGPYWDERTQKLYYVDMYVGDIHQWDSITGEDSSTTVGDVVSFAIPSSSGGLIHSSRANICHFDVISGQSTDLVKVDTEYPNNIINDAKCDAKGRLWAGTMGLPEWDKEQPFSLGAGSLYCLNNELKLSRQAHGFDLPNGMAWTANNRTMFFVDFFPKRIYAFDYDIMDGIASNQRILSKCEFMEAEGVVGKPDGMCIDTEDKIWVASFGRGQIMRIDPETGHLMQTVDIPGAKLTTSCCFGGRNLDEMYVTTAKIGLSEEDLKLQPNAGSLFKISGLGVKGTPAVMFEGFER